MPIHDQSYRRYEGARAGAGHAWTVIAAAGIRSMIARKKFLGLLLLAWMPFVVRTIQIYLSTNFPQAALLAPTRETFRDFLGQQDVFVFFIAIYVGSGLIAADKRANALQIYLSKPLSRVEYVAGKLAILMTFLAVVTWVPAILLLVVQMVFAGSFAFIRANLVLIPAITVLAALEVVAASFTMLALSSLSKSGRFVAVMYAGVLFFSDAMFKVISLVTRSTSLSWISLPGTLAQAGDLVFRLSPRYSTPPPVTLIAIVVVIALSVFILEREVRGVEVVT